MKFLGIAVLVLAVVAQVLGKDLHDAHERIKRGLSSQLEDFLHVTLRKMLKEGSASMGLPVLDPFEKSELPLDLDEEKVKANVNLTNLHVAGVAGYKVDVAKIAILSRKATVGLTFPNIHAKANYSAVGVAMDGVDIYGDGTFEATLEDFKVNAVVAIAVAPSVKIKSIVLKISLGALRLKATGLFHDENTSILLSEIISDMGPQIISDYHDEITSTVSTMLIEIANVFLHGKSLADIVGIIG